jgi:hypothetical protein
MKKYSDVTSLLFMSGVIHVKPQMRPETGKHPICFSPVWCPGVLAWMVKTQDSFCSRQDHWDLWVWRHLVLISIGIDP